MNNVSNKLEAEDTHVGLIKFKKANCTVGLTTALKPNDLKASIEIFCQKKIIRLSGLCCNNVFIENYDKSKLKYYKKLSTSNSEKVRNGMGNSHLNCLLRVSNLLAMLTLSPTTVSDTLLP